eukprot:TRINITY_DN1641_c0_g3_i1.p1 TRINITY_DN1641_c0_g3~~TRINITY_DN1641_c0_g3_i1.p1  ORF type:complete len:308 (+),score=66.52 TRINITY_DN1641_c0_g3_i1:119-1042(+)
MASSSELKTTTLSLPIPALSHHAIRLVAGGTAAALAESCTVPFDVLKVRLQLHKTVANSQISMGMIGMAKSIIRSEGPTALFKGFAPALLRQVAYTSITMVLYQPVRNVLGSADNPDPGYLVKLVSGGISGGVGVATVNPVEVVKVGLQADHSGSLSVRDTVRRIYSMHGLSGFLKGLAPNVTRGFIVNAAELGTYDHCKHKLVEFGFVSEGSLSSHFGGSFAAGFAGAAASNPIDVVKTRLMSQASCGSSKPYHGMVDCFKRIVREEGPSALYKGFVPNWLRKGPWCMVFFMSYEQIRALLQTKHV